MMKQFDKNNSLQGKRIGIFGKRSSGKTYTIIDLLKTFLNDNS